MTAHRPTSNVTIRRFLDPWDLLCVALAPLAAMALRDPDMFTGDRISSSAIYWLIGWCMGALMLLAFHLGRSLNHFLSMREVRTVGLAAISTAALTSLLHISLTRLDDVARSVPFLHFLSLMAFLLFARAVASKRALLREKPVHRVALNPEHVLVAGANQLAWFYMRMLHEFDLGRTDVVAVLDSDPSLLGRTMLGHPILAPPTELRRVVTEYAIHGVQIGRVLIAANRPVDGRGAWTETEELCRELSMAVEYLGDALGIDLEGAATEAEAAPLPSLRGYMLWKRVAETIIAFCAGVVLLPLAAIVAVGVMIDVGWPVLFWQKRDGLGGRGFLIYKFRTLHAPFDRNGRFVEENQRTSRFGDMLRRYRLDELPQLWNIVAGNMSFVGPRPLLPVDQPDSSRSRLNVLPGITGWAQIHGGKLVSADDKGVLDDWYVEHASFWLDVKIMARTLRTIVFGDDRTVAPLTKAGEEPGSERDEARLNAP